MNLTLFQSRWALFGFLVSGGFIGWMYAIEAVPGAREGSDVDVLLASGWTTFGFMILVCVYSLRKFVHRLGISPEFKMKVPIEDLEEAEQRMNEVRQQILLGVLANSGEIRAAAQKILDALGVNKVCRAVVDESTGPGPRFDIRVEPTMPLGRMARWLHFHVYVGLASGVLLWVHGGLSMESPMGTILNGLSVIVIVTGVVGTLLFAVGPRWMTRAEKDMNYEEAFVLDRSLADKIRGAYKALSPEQIQHFRSAGRTVSTAVVERTALMQIVETEPGSRKELEDIMVLVSQRKRIHGDLRSAARIKFIINIWRAVHVPGSIVLLGFSMVHVFSVLWY
ncbi:MAG: hypothetical protein CMJ83_12145 [Planctomycetes bacterium]|nr:hypothetical protein [Planctomycetota bacterium]